MSLQDTFPNLRDVPHRATSPKTDKYNCIAWAAGQNDRWWEPAVGYYWPVEGNTLGTVKAAVEMFKSLGFSVCKDGSLETGYDKIVIYGQDEEYTHAARQIENGKWTSKIGCLEDIEHDTAEALVGAEYGTIAKFMRRKKS